MKWPGTSDRGICLTNIAASWAKVDILLALMMPCSYVIQLVNDNLELCPM
jgi:hypothetical protein